MKKLQIQSQYRDKKIHRPKVHKSYKIKEGAMLPHEGYHMGRPRASKPHPMKIPTGSTLI